MAGSILTAPSTTLSTNTVWQDELAYTEGARYGYDGVSLTEWGSGNTTKPEIASGSTLEINGAMCEYASDTALTDESGLADGWCYIKHVVSGTEGSEIVTPTLTNTWGTWDTAKQGYYDGSGNRYSLFVMYRSGAITKIFTEKTGIRDESARLGYRYYSKVYTGTTTTGYTGAWGIVQFDTVFSIGEVISIDSAFISNTGIGSYPLWYKYDTDKVFEFFRDSGDGVEFQSVYSDSGFSGKSYKLSVTYKLTL